MCKTEQMLVDLQNLKIKQAKHRIDALEFFNDYCTHWSMANDLEIQIINTENAIKALR